MAGFPLVNERVDGHVRWRLMDGFRKVPALNFSPTELMALLLGRHLLKPLEGTHIHSALDAALSKASAVLPAARHDYVHQLQDASQ
jgi:predicted DNA-binding transcriptional regulator YafY